MVTPLSHPSPQDPRMLSLQALGQLVASSPAPVILLEGRRAIPPEYRELAENLGWHLATRLPQAKFRSGNATGSDEAFSSGVARVDLARLHIVTPSPGHRRENRILGAIYDSLQGLSDKHRQDLGDATIAATPANRGLVRAWLDRPTGPLSAKAAYLIRDTLKVIGLPGLISPATTALFYVDPADPEAGGTGHTIRVCRRYGIPATTQDAWGRWTRE